MADILISKFTTQIPRVGATPATPGFAESEGQDPVAPSGTPQVYTPVTIGSPANGLSISGTQVLTIGLASTSTTGALSSIDWNTFNGKLNLTSPITGYTVGANTALADTDTILQAFGKVQGQINARISGTIASGQVAFGTGVNTVGGSAGLTWDNTNRQLALSRDGANVSISLVRTGSLAGTASINIAGTGVLELRPATSANLNIIHGGVSPVTSVFSGLGRLGVATANPTDVLDVNGTARIRTISNLGSAATSVLVPSATGVVSLRTLAEFASDAGLTNFWTLTGSDIFRNSAVAIGRTTIPAGNLLTLRQTTNDDTVTSLRCERLDGTLRFEVRNSFALFQQEVAISGLTAGVQALRVQQRTNDDTVASILAQNLAGNTRLEVRNSYSQFFHELVVNGLAGSTQSFRVRNNNTNPIVVAQDNAGTTVFQVANSGMITSRGLTITDAFNVVLGTTTGTKIGTATNQKIGFFNATPIVQPSGDILTALSNLGLVASPTITQVDQFAVKTTASADQTLPSGTLTILDYDTTLLNNSTATYTVGTTGRITINTTGIYTITAGVVIEADAVTALESAFLGIFRNGDLVAISSINTTIAAGAQSGLSTSTILSLTATDIIDCRALVNSVGGVANGLARRLGTLLGANATQVNSLSITKNSM